MKKDSYNLVVDPNGKITYKPPGDAFDIDKFNRNFDQYRIKRETTMKKEMDEKLAKLNAPPQKTPVWDESIGQILINMKDSIFDIIDDLLIWNTKNIFIKNHRLFYIGLFIIICIIIGLGLASLDTKETQPIHKLVIHKYEMGQETGQGAGQETGQGSGQWDMDQGAGRETVQGSGQWDMGQGTNPKFSIKDQFPKLFKSINKSGNDY